MASGGCVQHSMNGLRRFIEVYDRRTERLVSELPLADVELAQLRGLLGVGADDPVFGCYGLTSAQCAALEDRLGVRLDCRKYEHFLGAEFDYNGRSPKEIFPKPPYPAPRMNGTGLRKSMPKTAQED